MSKEEPRKKLNETELFLLKLNACYEPELSVKGTQKAIQIIEDLQEKIDILIEDNNQLEEIRIKATEILKIGIDRCNSALSNDETSIVSKHSLLKLERQCYKELLEILEGDKE